MEVILSNQESYDLTAACEELRKHKPYIKFATMINRQLSRQSIIVDLQSSITALDLIAENFASEEFRKRTAPALMTHAVVMYARATHVEGEGRSRINVTKYFSEKEKISHEQVIKLRNTRIAHYGNGQGSYGSEWIDERFVMIFGEHGCKIAYPYKRANFFAELIQNIYDLIDCINENLLCDIALSEQSIREEFNVLFVGDEQFRNIVKSKPFVHSDFFSNPKLHQFDGLQKPPTEFWRPSKKFGPE